MKATAYIKLILIGCCTWALCCCSRDELRPVASDEITLSPATEQTTRAAITGTDMPDGFHIWLSTYLQDDANPSNNGNYFTGVEYAKDVTEWKSATPRYWPLSGTLDFLGIATDPTELTLTCTWNASKNTSRVDVEVPETYATQTEVLYAASYPLEGNHASVPMAYRHSQARLVFKVRADVLDLIRITDITIRNVYTDGTLTVYGSGPLKAEWNFSASTAHDRQVPKPAVDYYLEPGAVYEPFAEGIILPEQQNQIIDVHFKQRANTGIDWSSDLVLEETYTFDDVFRLWHMGKQYVYNIDFTMAGITFTPSVEEWIY